MRDEAESASVTEDVRPSDSRDAAVHEDELPDDGANLEAATELLAELRRQRRAATDEPATDTTAH